MARRKFDKRILAILLTLVMVFNLTGLGTYATEVTGPALVENFQDTYYKQDGTAGSSEDWEIHLSKTAAPAGQDNVFDITLTVETKDISTRLSGATHAAVALVLDVSSSMNKDTGSCADCGKAENHSDHRGRDSVCDYESVTHLALLKYAVKSFLDSYANTTAEGDKRMVAIVKFATDADTVLSWVDVSDEANLTAAKNAVDAMGSTSGTNIEAGLALGRNLLNMSALSDIPLANQSLILFSDGAPTVAVGDANNSSTSHVGSDGRGINGFGGNSSKDDLAGILSGISAKKKAVAYNTDAALLNTVFGQGNVVASGAGSLIPDLTAEADRIITSKTNASTVTDPMATGVSMISVSSAYESDSRKWDLSAFDPIVEDGITTYTITYQVELDPKAVAEDPVYPGYTVLTPANGATTLNYTYGENNTPVSADFNEPNIRGIYSYTVRYDYVGEVPAGAPEAPANQTYKAGQFVQVAEAPGLENYTFSGWSRTDFTMPAEDVVIVGSWKENAKYDYSVIYNSNFGVVKTKADAENVTGTYQTAFAIEVDDNGFVRENYTFIGWAAEPRGEVVYAPGDVISFREGGSEELFAVWMEHDKYSYMVIYNGNGGAREDGSGSYGDEENVTGTYATEHTVSVDDNAFIRDNHDFIGWSTSPDGTGMGYTAEEAVNLTAENNSLTLYALWAEHEKYDYTVIYNEGHGENPATTADSENVTGTYETFKTITVDENVFTRENYTFMGWATALGGEVAYLPGMALNFTAENNSLTLYARWKLVNRDYTVEYLVQIDDEAYVPYEGEVPAGGTLPHGTPVGKDIINPPAEISDSDYTYTFVNIQEIVLGEGENVVKVYFRYETPPVPEVPAEPVPEVPAEPVPEVPTEPVPEVPAEPVPETPAEPEPDYPVEVMTVDGDGLVELPDEDVPLAAVPHTGDPMLIYAGITLLSGAGLAYLGLGKKKEEED